MAVVSSATSATPSLQSPSPTLQPSPDLNNVGTSLTLQLQSPTPQPPPEGSSVITASELPPPTDGGSLFLEGFTAIILVVVAGVVILIGSVMFVSALIACALKKRGQKSSTSVYNEAKGMCILQTQPHLNQQLPIHANSQFYCFICDMWLAFMSEVHRFLQLR